MTKTIISILLFLISITVFSQQETKHFSLQEAIDYALEHNRTAKNAQRDIEAAKQQKWETISTGLPQINASIGYNKWLQQQLSLIPAEFFGGNSGDFVEIAFGTKQSVNAKVTLEQKIFDGSYLVGLQSAKVFLDISRNAKEKTDLEVRKAVINAYGNVMLAEQSVQILERNKAVLEKNLNELTKIYENGLEEEESVEQLQITLSSVQSSLKNAIRLKTLAYQLFNITLGQDLNTNSILTDTLESLTAQNIVLRLLDEDENIENTIDYQIAVNDKISKALLLKLEKSKALPTINAFVNGVYDGYNDNFKFLKKEQPWLGSSLLGINMNIPIFSSLGRSAATQRAKINLEKAQEDLTETEQKLKLQIATAKSDYQFAIEDYGNKKENLNLAGRIETKTRPSFLKALPQVLI